MTACFLFIDYFIVQYGEPPFPFRVDSLQCKNILCPSESFLKLKVENYGEPPFPFRVDSLQCKNILCPSESFLKLKVENYGEPPFPFRVDSLQCKKHIMPERNIVIVFTILYGRISSARKAKPTAKATNPQLFRPSRCRLCP